MKKIYLIPGYKHDINTPGYKELIQAFENIGYTVMLIEISWKYRVMSDYIAQAQKQIQAQNNDTIIGFSFGAMIALRVTEQQKFQKVVLCSLSPYFSEDLQHLPLGYRFNLGMKRWRDFSKHYSEKDIKNILGNEYSLIYGGAESERLLTRSIRMIEKLSIQEIGIVEGVGHDIADSMYQEEILKFLK